jgi:hypothetical protein
MAKFAISCTRLRKNQKRARFSDVVESVQGQLNELGNNLTNALIVGPKGATERQVLLALKQGQKKT